MVAAAVVVAVAMVATVIAVMRVCGLMPMTINGHAGGGGGEDASVAFTLSSLTELNLGHNR
jgi:hypothetical protein